MTATYVSTFLKALGIGIAALLCFNIGSLLFCIITSGFGPEWSIGFDDATFTWNGKMVGWPLGDWKAGALFSVITAASYVQMINRIKR